jgi:pyruvate dehydrogenase E2 component (dihydrolipoamide acetyltransferase)
MVELTVPKVGLTVETLEVVAWHKHSGDTVAEGENVVDLAADKADLAIEAPASGVLSEIRAAEGDTVAPGDVLAVISVAGEVVAPAPAARTEEPALAAKQEAAVAAPPTATKEPVPRKTVAQDSATVAASSANGAARIRISPVARRIAAAHGIAINELAGTGPRGRIVRRDVEVAASPRSATSSSPGRAAAVSPPPSSSAAGSGAPGDDLVEVRWTAARRATARAMALSTATAAPVTLHRRAGAEAAMSAVKRLKAGGLPATFTHALMYAAAHALASHPALNAIWDGDRLLQSRRRHVGLAVDDGGDLLLGVVADADARDHTA